MKTVRLKELIREEIRKVVKEARNFKKAKQALIDFNNGKIGEDDMVKSVVKSLGFKFDEFSEEEAGLELSSKIKKGKIPTDDYILNNVIDVLSESVVMKISEFKKLISEEIRKVIRESDVENYFSDYNVKLTSNFNLEKFAKYIQMSKEDAETVLVNLEDDKVMKDIAKGNYTTFDVFDPSIFNDEYDQMMDDLGLEPA